MERELGLDVMDLPHGYIADSGQPQAECRCGRERAHVLHDSKPVVERASSHAGQQLITEKGS